MAALAVLQNAPPSCTFVIADDMLDLNSLMLSTWTPGSSKPSGRATPLFEQLVLVFLLLRLLALLPPGVPIVLQAPAWWLAMDVWLPMLLTTPAVNQ